MLERMLCTHFILFLSEDLYMVFNKYKKTEGTFLQLLLVCVQYAYFAGLVNQIKKNINANWPANRYIVHFVDF